MNLLDLPLDIRKRIWRLLLTRTCPIAFDQERKRVIIRSYFGGPCDNDEIDHLDLNMWDIGNMKPNWRCGSPKFSLEILYVCRQIRHEASNVLYGENRFVLTARESKELPNIDIARFSSIHLYAPKLEIGDSLSKYQKMLEQIQLSPDLSFAFTSKFTDNNAIAELAKSIVALGPVRSCSIRVGKPLIAKKIALEITNPLPISQRAFPQYSKLPKELQLQVLSWTDLAQDYPISRGRLTIIFRCCTRCCDSLLDCCCTHVGFSFTCQCANSRLPFFQVSHEFRRDAMQIAFSKGLFKFSGTIQSMLQFFHKIEPFLFMVRRIVFALSLKDRGNWGEGVFTWDEFTSYFSSRFNLPSLSLTIIMSFVKDDDVDEPETKMTPFLDDLRDDLIFARSMLPSLKTLAKLGLKHLSLEFPNQDLELTAESMEKEVMGEDYINNGLGLGLWDDKFWEYWCMRD